MTMSNSTMTRGAVSATRLLTAIAAMVILGLVMAAQASAAVKRPLLYQLGIAGTAAGEEFQSTGRVAFDQVTKRLYVIDNPFTPADRKLYAFKVEGPESYVPVGGAFPLSLSGLGDPGDIAVNSTSHNIYISSESTDTLYGFDQTGTPLGGNFPIIPAGAKNICGVTTDAAGNIWASDYGSTPHRLRKFDSSGNAVPGEDINTASIGNGEICQVDFDSNGDLYAVERFGNERLLKVTATSGYTTTTVVDNEIYTQDVVVNRTSHRVISIKYFALREYEPDGTLFREFATGLDVFGYASFYPYFQGGAFNEGTEELYIANNQGPRRVGAFGPRRTLPDITTEGATATTRTTATVTGKIQLAGGPEVTECFVQYGINGWVSEEGGTAPCSPATPYPGATTNVTASLTGLKAETAYTYRVVAKTANGINVGEMKQVNTDKSVKDVTTLPADEIDLTSARLNGSLDPDGVAGGTTYYFRYGLESEFGFEFTAPVAPPGAPAGEAAGTVPKSANVSGLTAGKTYKFQLVGVNSFGTTEGATLTFVPSTTPAINSDYAEKVNTDGATLRAALSPNGVATQYHFEYGLEDCAIATCEESPVGEVGTAQNTLTEVVSFQWAGLDEGQTYHFRLVATNARGTTTGSDRVFRTYAKDSGIDICQDAQARQQSGSSLLLDCRGYELVSAPDAGGFDVVSDLVFGQEPLVAYPRAEDSALYSVDAGVIPGVAGDPTNLGRDPYVATRNSTGDWVTRYVGLPSDAMADPGAFGSPLLGADASLTDFAFGGKDICDPCFADGSTNIPLRLDGGAPIEGMAGPSAPPAGERNPSGKVAKYLSDDGTHLIFGSTEQFQPDGNDGSVSIYDRNLTAGTTQVASTLPDGTTMSGEVGELDASEDGSRIVVATKVSTDGAGNDYWHPYLHIGTSKNSVDLAPTTTTGVLYAGMSSDGSTIFFTTKDKLSADTDASADLYQATVGSGGPAVITRLSTGAPPPTGDTNACDPVANADGNNWNEVGGASPDNCGVVAIAGGGGVAPENGTVYFLSPEKLDGSGTLNEPNLFVVRPGSAPRFVATLEPNNPAVRDAVKDREVHRYGDFQVNVDGRYAAFNSTLSLSAIPAFGQGQIYRYDADSDQVDCASCAPTLAAATTDTSLPPYGLALTDDGRVFFSSQESLALRDTNERKDAYEWEDGDVQLVSLGIGPHDSGVLSVSADGTNAFFFTRDTLVHKDANGSRIKLYVAREGGGFVYTPPPLPCAASDECHGAGTEAPGPPNIKTQTGTGNAQPSRPNCEDLAARANQNEKKARQARKKAAAASSASQRRALLRQARKLERKSKQLSDQATACRESSGGNG
jgi:hypothetical protein